MLVAPIVRDRSRTVLLSSDDGSVQREVSAIMLELEEAASREMIEDGVELSSLRTERRVDARYRGQSFELSVKATDWVDAFHEAHERQYGYRRYTAVEAVTLRVRVEAPGETIPIAKTPITAISGKRPARFSSVLVEGKRREVPVLERSELPLEEVLMGPAVVAEYSTTTWCPQGWQLRRDTWDLLHLSRDLSASDASG
jgi:N-methylhydantoinase A/oxoprolinase/acetone carboxylase beta subunit